LRESRGRAIRYTLQDWEDGDMDGEKRVGIGEDGDEGGIVFDTHFAESGDIGVEVRDIRTR